MNVKIERMETQDADKGLVLSKKKRFYKTESVTKQERSTMMPLLEGGAECTRWALRSLQAANPDRDNHRKLLLGRLRCNPVNSLCVPLSSVLRVNVKSVEAKDGHQTLILQKRRKNYKKGGISKKEEKALEPVLEGSEGCKCELLENANKKARFLIFGTKHGDRYTVNYVREFNNDKDLKNALKVMSKGDACLQIIQGANLGVDPPPSSSSSSSSSPPSSSSPATDKKDGKGKKGKNKKQKKGKKQGKGQKPKDKSEDNGDDKNTNTNSNSKGKNKGKTKGKNDPNSGRTTPSPGN
ncbi:hypothetical protein C0Q70_05200 [Pomacea canaliculata]|uniref:Uncharacterized protein n=1 Tax=Pomacea canaliculata TaxID=400727 RepID=A0A2T7PKK3_POMCA|nr:hypothetical protein C0Q70_05200 [Pomacea canaliculata]